MLHEGLNSILPVEWSEISAERDLETAEKRVLNEASDFRLARGLCIPVHGPRGEVGLVNVVSDASEREFRRIVAAHKHSLHLMAIHYHAAVRSKLTDDEAPFESIRLTMREVECLLWTAEGKSAWEISSILNCSERTVNFHLLNAMRKLGVYSKTHAVAKMLSLGLVQL